MPHLPHVVASLTSDGQLPAVLHAALPRQLVRGPAAQELAGVLDAGDEDHRA